MKRGELQRAVGVALHQRLDAKVGSAETDGLQQREQLRRRAARDVGCSAELEDPNAGDADGTRSEQSWGSRLAEGGEHKRHEDHLQ